MFSNDKKLQNVADMVSKIMNEKLHPNQQKLDVHEPEKDKLTAHDFKKLRAGKKAPEVKKEEVEQIEELSKTTKAGYIGAASKDVAARGEKAMGLSMFGSKKDVAKYKDKTDKRVGTIGKVAGQLSKEEVELTKEDADPCWKGYKMVGMKDKNGRKVPNCVPGEGVPAMKKEEVEQIEEGIEVKKEYNDKTEAEHGVYHNGKKIGYVVHHKPSGTHTAYHSPQDDDDYGQIDDFRSHHDAVSQIRHSAGLGVHEEVEQIDEYKSTGGVYKHKGTYGTEKSVEAGYTDYDKENEMAKKLSKPAKKKYGARQNFVRSTRVNESFTEILSQYKEGGLKNLFESFKKEEQILSEEVQEETVQVEVTNFDAVNGVTIETIEERTLTEPEMKKKEEVVKSMKKGLTGFKARYGDKAKSVMYATATKIAKKD